MIGTAGAQLQAQVSVAICRAVSTATIVGKLVTVPELATTADIPSWLEVVREVEPLFGPMPTFDGTLERSIARSGAWCIRVDGVVAAGMIVSPIERAAIDWLAVRRSMRGQGFGRDLVAHALRAFEGASEVIVDTFGNDNVEGRPARRLYESFGFIAAEELERGPEGGTRQRYRLVTSA
jgi:ribosomal protein S18 acetylase RimI-like enzyme